MSTNSGLFDLTKGQDLAFWRRMQEFGVGKLNIERFLSDDEYAIAISQFFQKLEGQNKQIISITQAKKILGKANVFGPSEIFKAFDVELSPEQIPEIKFTRRELIEAKKRNQFLVLRIDGLTGRKSATMKNLYELCQPKFDKQKAGKILYDIDWYKKESFYTDAVPRSGWHLVSKEPIKDSLNKNFLQQTKVIVDYITDMFVEQNLPKSYQDAINEFNQEFDEIQTLMSSDWKVAAKRLPELKINQLSRRLPVEVLYDFLIYFLNNQERLLKNKYDWTFSLYSRGGLVGVGIGDDDGLDVNSHSPDNYHGILGWCFSRQSLEICN